MYSKKIKLMRKPSKTEKDSNTEKKKCWLPEERSGGTDEIGLKRYKLPAKINVM